jgi:hypothetical protein
MHAGWYGLTLSNGTMLFSTCREYIDGDNAWTELNTLVYVSFDGGENWHQMGYIGNYDQAATTTFYPQFFFSLGDHIYMDGYGSANLRTVATYFDNSQKWIPTIDEPVGFHPVYYVGTWNAAGSDAANGVSADTPWLTVNKAMENNLITMGARVRVAAGTFEETDSIFAEWSGHARPGRDSVVIEGQGWNTTNVFRSAGGGGFEYLVYILASRVPNTTTTPIIFKNMHIYNPRNTDNLSAVLTNADSFVEFHKCKIGDVTQDDGIVFSVGSASALASLKIKQCYITMNPISAGFANIAYGSFGSSVVEIENSIIINGALPVYLRYAGSTLILKNCTFYDYTSRAVSVLSGVDQQPTIKNCIFLGKAGSVPIYDSSGLTEDAVDYNCYNLNNGNVTDGGHSLVVGTNPLIRNAADGDFRLKDSSPCKKAGVDLSITNDILDHQRATLPSIGAYE